MPDEIEFDDGLIVTRCDDGSLRYDPGMGLTHTLSREDAVRLARWILAREDAR